jgi:hypothetical protein
VAQLAVKRKLPVKHHEVFPHGAWAIGDPAQVEDYEKKKNGEADYFLRDKETGKKVFGQRVLDADPEARKGQAEITVKIISDELPVLPPPVPGLPFRPIEFEGLSLTPYVDQNGRLPRLSYSISATGIRAQAPKSQAQGA